MDTSQLTLRDATARDEAVIQSLIADNNLFPLGNHWSRFVVIETRAEEIVACGQIKPHRDGTHELASIVVKESWRRQGLAHRVIEHLLAKHPGRLYLMCAAHRGGLYEQFGFSPIVDPAEMPRFFRLMKKIGKLSEKLGGNEVMIMVLEEDLEQTR